MFVIKIWRWACFYIRINFCWISSESWSVVFPGEEQNKEALQDVEDENQWDVTALDTLSSTFCLSLSLSLLSQVSGPAPLRSPWYHRKSSEVTPSPPTLTLFSPVCQFSALLFWVTPWAFLNVPPSPPLPTLQLGTIRSSHELTSWVNRYCGELPLLIYLY